MHASKLSHLTDEELLLDLDDKRYQSPLIGELCKRLEKLVRLDSSTGGNIECPVCEANLRVDYDPGNDLFDVKVNR